MADKVTFFISVNSESSSSTTVYAIDKTWDEVGPVLARIGSSKGEDLRV